jgi:FtsP/CotA-like multicopper oxidase with cupredoxin domain
LAAWGGPIVIEDPTPLLAPYETHILMLKDISLSGSVPTPHTMMMDYMNGMEGNIIMVNGQVNPVLTIKPGQVQRWRILNASNARFYKISLEGHSLNVIGTDGGLLDKPYPQSYIVLSPAERVDLLIKASTTKKNYRFLSLPYSRMGMMTSPQITLMTMTVKGTAVNNTIPSLINPDAKRLTMDTSVLPKKTFVLSMGMGRGYINGHDFDVEPDETHSMVDTYEVWEIINQSNMDHPWHQHVNAAQVISITGGDSAYRTLYTTAPARKDTIIVPKGGSIKLLMPVMDWTGMTMYHCHILEHEDIGMMGMWHIMGDMPMGGM